MWVINYRLDWSSAALKRGPSMSPLPTPNVGYRNNWSTLLIRNSSWGSCLPLTNQDMETFCNIVSIGINDVPFGTKTTRQRLLQTFHIYISLAIRAVEPWHIVLDYTRRYVSGCPSDWAVDHQHVAASSRFLLRPKSTIVTYAVHYTYSITHRVYMTYTLDLVEPGYWT